MLSLVSSTVVCHFTLTGIVEAALHLIVQARVAAPRYTSVCRWHLRLQEFALTTGCNALLYDTAKTFKGAGGCLMQRQGNATPCRSAGRHRT